MVKLNYEFLYVKPEDIDFTSREYLFSYPDRKALLIESIRELGLLNPPLLYPSEDKLCIISGEGRIQASLELGWKSIPALVFKEHLSPKELLLISLETNLWRGLNLVEKALFISKARAIFELKEILAILPKLGLSPHPHWIFYLEKVSSLEDPFKRLLVEERLNPKVVDILVKLEWEERREFLEVLEKINLTFSEQREVLQALVDFQKREGLKGLLPKKLKETLQEEDPTTRKRTFLEILNQLRYPSYYPKQKAIEKLKRHFQGKGINIDFIPYLEKREVTVNFKAKNPQELEAILEFLRHEGEGLFRVFEG